MGRAKRIALFRLGYHHDLDFLFASTPDTLITPCLHSISNLHLTPSSFAPLTMSFSNPDRPWQAWEAELRFERALGLTEDLYTYVPSGYEVTNTRIFEQHGRPAPSPLEAEDGLKPGWRAGEHHRAAYTLDGQPADQGTYSARERYTTANKQKSAQSMCVLALCCSVHFTYPNQTIYLQPTSQQVMKCSPFSLVPTVPPAVCHLQQIATGRL